MVVLFCVIPAAIATALWLVIRMESRMGTPMDGRSPASGGLGPVTSRVSAGGTVPPPES
jgi:hypothetical protein